MKTLDALRLAYKRELGGDGYLDSTLVRRIIDALDAYTAEAELEDSTPSDDLAQWAAILLNAATMITQSKEAEG